MFSKSKGFVFISLMITCFTSVSGQTINSGADLSNRINTITTAVPFLRITGDTRSGGMGDVGIAVGDPDANSAQLNGARMAFVDKDYGVGLSFTPWLKSLVGDIYLANLSGYYRIKNVQTIHASIRYFSLGTIQYTDENGLATIQVHPNEFYIDGGYSRKLNDIASIGATLRFIYSNIAPNAGTASQSVKPGIAGSADISVLVDKHFAKKTGNMSHELLWGLCISNIGSKMTYTSSVTKDFIPTNLGIGFGYKLHLDAKDEHTVGVYADFNKLLVPTPQYTYDSVRHTNVPSTGYKSQSPITGMISSFYDAPGGATEEFRSITAQIAAEYFYKKMLGLRLGYFYEHPTKGNRNFLTVGATIKYNVATLHLSYLVPTSNQRNPLDNTFSFSLAFEFAKGAYKKKTEAAPEEATGVVPTPSPDGPKKKKKADAQDKDVAPGADPAKN